MNSRFPRWLLITLVVLAVAVLTIGIVLLLRSQYPYLGWALLALVIAALVIIGATTIPQLIKLYRFQKYFKQHEAQLQTLPSLMQSGRTQEALSRFEGVMKHAPENAYLIYLRAFFLQAAGKLPEALGSANKALAMADKDPFLPTMLQQMGGQMGQPSTVPEFKAQLEEMRESLEPRVQQMRVRREKAVAKRKKKSR